MTRKRWRAVAVLGAGVVMASSAVAVAGGSGRVTAEKDFTISPHDSKVSAPDCGRDTYVTGGGFNVGDRGVMQDLLLTKDNGVAILGAGNPTDSDIDATAFALCRKSEELIYQQQLQPSHQTHPNQSRYTTDFATCPEGTSVTGGGSVVAGPFSKIFPVASYPFSNRSWRVVTYQTDPDESFSFAAFAVCDADHHYAIRENTQTTPRRPGKFDLTASAKCRSDFSTTGGGFYAHDTRPGIRVSRPQGSQAWLSRARLGGFRSLTSYAVCRKEH